MSFLESAKQYTGSDLETIFFRPILSGDSARELGVRVLYNMPVPTTIQLWDGQRNVLQKYSAAGWTGGNAATKLQKTISLGRVKAELGFSAADYFSLVYEKIAARADVNMDDLTGTELEQAETALFKQAVAESIRATMWVGDTSAASGYNTFDGFLKTVKAGAMQEKFYNSICQAEDFSDPGKVVAVLDDLWMNADERVKDMKADGQLAFFVTSDIYYAFEKYLDGKSADAAYMATTEGRPSLAYHGIPLVDVRLGSYLASTSLHKSFCLLTDRRNLVLAVNTADFPGNEVRLMSAYFVKCTGCVKDENGKVVEVHCTYDPESRGGNSPDGRKVKGTIHWVNAEQSVKAQVRLYENIIDEEKGVYNEDGSLNLNPNSLTTLTECRLEPAFAQAQAYDRFQFVRQGFFCVDYKDTKPGELVFNRIVSLKSSYVLPK